MPILRHWTVGHSRALNLGPKAVIMGIVNATPDSFSGDGLAANVDAAIAQAVAMAKQGAAIIDVGGESTRPDAAPVSAALEQERILPVIEGIRAISDVLISVDTYRAETARRAVESGAHIVNDVWGLSRDPAIARLVAETGSGVVIMHTGRDRKKLPDVIDDQRHFLVQAIEVARNASIRDEQIVLDPGFGFAKETAEENIELMERFGELLDMDFPWLVGASRKRFLGAVTGQAPLERDGATAAASIALRLAGADIFRVHDVVSSRDALAVADAMLAARARRQGRNG